MKHETASMEHERVALALLGLILLVFVAAWFLPPLFKKSDIERLMKSNDIGGLTYHIAQEIQNFTTEDDQFDLQQNPDLVAAIDTLVLYSSRNNLDSIESALENSQNALSKYVFGKLLECRYVFFDADVPIIYYPFYRQEVTSYVTGLVDIEGLVKMAEAMKDHEHSEFRVEFEKIISRLDESKTLQFQSKALQIQRRIALQIFEMEVDRPDEGLPESFHQQIEKAFRSRVAVRSKLNTLAYDVVVYEDLKEGVMFSSTPYTDQGIYSCILVREVDLGPELITLLGLPLATTRNGFPVSIPNYREIDDNDLKIHSDWKKLQVSIDSLNGLLGVADSTGLNE